MNHIKAEKASEIRLIPNSYYSVSVSLREGNPFHEAICFTDFDGRPFKFFNGTYEDPVMYKNDTMLSKVRIKVYRQVKF